MRLSFHDPRSGQTREFRPVAPPFVGLEAAEERPRAAAVLAAVADALRFLGLKPGSGAEIRVGGADAGAAAAWLRVGPLTGARGVTASALAARGFRAADFRHLCAKTHYRHPLAFTWENLDVARAERAWLLAAVRAAAGAPAPSSTAVAAYRHRLREALGRDLDLPGALDCVRGALRPGALSPASRAAFLREALPALGVRPAPMERNDIV